jgi:hypothetical protein
MPLREQLTYEPAPLVILHCVEPNGQFGGAQCQSDSAQVNGKVWQREPGETPQDFEERVIASLPSARQFPTVVAFFPSENVSGPKRTEAARRNAI